MKPKQNFFTERINLKKIRLSDGREYTVRQSRERFFFPDEWMVFYDNLKESQKLTFNFLINTGARINEIQNVEVGDCDLERNSLILRITKTRNKDGSRKARVIPISSQFSKQLRKNIKENNPSSSDMFKILSTPAANIAMKKALEKAEIKDFKMFSIHNIRKTLETWLIALDIDSLKITKHLGHSIMVASKHYVGSDTFSWEDKKLIRQILGDLYEKRN